MSDVISNEPNYRIKKAKLVQHFIPAKGVKSEFLVAAAGCSLYSNVLKLVILLYCENGNYVVCEQISSLQLASY